jgi:hypothetical protein
MILKIACKARLAEVVFTVDVHDFFHFNMLIAYAAVKCFI